MRTFLAFAPTTWGLLIAGSLLFACRPAAAQTVIQDGTFQDDHWAITKVSDTSSSPSLSSALGAQQSSGGNPDFYRLVVHNWYGPGGVGFAHLFTPQEYRPGEQGGLTAVRYDFDMLILNAASSATVLYAPLLAQGGKFYVKLPGSTPTSTGAWLPQAYAGLTAGDFSATDGSGAPDFSAAGAPIRFGFYTGNGTAFSEQSITTSGIDNWKVTLTQSETGGAAVPEPSAFLLLLPTLGFLFVLHRRPKPQPQRVRIRRNTPEPMRAPEGGRHGVQG